MIRGGAAGSPSRAGVELYLSVVIGIVVCPDDAIHLRPPAWSKHKGIPCGARTPKHNARFRKPLLSAKRMRLLRLLAILAWFPTLFGQPLDSDRPVGQKGDESIVREQSREQVEDIDPRLEGWTPEKQPNPNNYPRSAQEWVGYGVPGALLLRYMAHVSHWDFVECLKMARVSFMECSLLLLLLPPSLEIGLPKKKF